VERGRGRRHLSESTGSISNTTATYGNYSTTPTGDTGGRRAGRAQRRFSSLSDRGWVSLTFKTNVLTTAFDQEKHHVSQNTARRELRGDVLQRRAAAVSADEAKQLGTTLTAVGAEKAGNKEGTIPEYTGGIKAPRDFKAGSGFRPIRTQRKSRALDHRQGRPRNADKLTEGTKELLKRYPTMRVDVYPTHRTVALPQRVLDNTLKNATGAKTVEGGVALENVMAGYPFPIPKSGSEAIWNHLLRYNGLGYDNGKYENWNVDSAGVPTLAVTGELNWAWPIFDPKKTGPINATDPYWLVKINYVGPRAATAKRCCGSTPSIR
jgi:hypothetical protein